MKRMRAFMAMFLTAAIAGQSGAAGLTPVLAAESEAASYEGVELEMATQMYGDALDALKDLISGFEAETGCRIQLTEYSDSDYESAMKTRMAAGELPDIWETHGWSRLRYGEYLEPIENEPWYANANEMTRAVLEDAEGHAYALVLTGAITCNIWNKTVLDENGLDYTKIRTWDDFKDACRILTAAGIVPISNNANANLTSNYAGVFTSYKDGYADDSEAQLNGTYDWQSYKKLLETLAELFDMGAMWDDISTMSNDDLKERIAGGRSAVQLDSGASYCRTFHNLNDENDYVIAPVFAASDSGRMYCLTGEGYAAGVWNESAHKDAALAFLAYMAENGNALAVANGGLPGMSNIEFDADDYYVQAVKIMEETFPDLVYANMWDREYMPSGMWNPLGEAAGMICADWSESSQEAIIAFLKENYDEKWAAANEG